MSAAVWLLLALLTPYTLSSNPKLQRQEAIDLVQDFTTGIKSTIGDTPKTQALSASMTEVLSRMTDKDTEEHYGRVGAAATAGLKALKMIGQGDPSSAAQGLIEAAAAVVGLVPGPAGLVISTLLSIVGAAIGLGQKSPSMSEVIRQLVREEILAQRHRELVDEYWGAMMVMQNTHAVLSAMHTQSAPSLAQDLTFLSCQIGSTTTLRTLGLLKSNILRHGPAVEWPEQAVSVEENLILYVRLSAFRKVLLNMARTVYMRAGLTTHIQLAIDNILDEMDEADAKWMQVIDGKQDSDFRAFRLYLDLRDAPEVVNYLENIGVDVFHSNKMVAETGCFKISKMAEEGRCFFARKVSDLLLNYRVDFCKKDATELQFSLENNKHIRIKAGGRAVGIRKEYFVWRYLTTMGPAHLDMNVGRFKDSGSGYSMYVFGTRSPVFINDDLELAVQNKNTDYRRQAYWQDHTLFHFRPC